MLQCELKLIAVDTVPVAGIVPQATGVLVQLTPKIIIPSESITEFNCVFIYNNLADLTASYKSNVC